MTYEQVQEAISKLPKYETLEELLEANNKTLPKDSHLFIDNDFVAIRETFVWFNEEFGEEELEYHYYWFERGSPRYPLADLLDHFLPKNDVLFA